MRLGRHAGPSEAHMVEEPLRADPPDDITIAMTAEDIGEYVQGIA